MKSTLKKIFPKLYTKYLYKKKGINRLTIEKKISQLDQCGISDAEELGIIISLTSYGERLSDVHLTLYSLLTQSYNPYKIVLCLAEEEFPNREFDLPLELKSILKWGIEIIWYKDIRSYKKLIPTRKKYPDHIIVTADDDIFYPNKWLEKLVLSYKKAPKYIHAHISNRVLLQEDESLFRYTDWPIAIEGGFSFSNFFKGFGGVLYPPNSLHEEVLAEELFQSLAPTADDIWFWAMAVLNGTKIMRLENPTKSYRYTDIEREFGNQKLTLHEINVLQGRNDDQIKNIITYYPCILERLIAEQKKDKK